MKKNYHHHDNKPRTIRFTLDLYPTGSVGIFDIYVEYKDKRR
jgi:hypothetical protein